jgi:hypothetical protein
MSEVLWTACLEQPQEVSWVRTVTHWETRVWAISSQAVDAPVVTVHEFDQGAHGDQFAIAGGGEALTVAVIPL